MKDLSTVPYHKVSEELTKILSVKTQNTNTTFFRAIVAYYFCKMASMMRTNVVTQDRGTIPVNMYAICLAVSGSGKGLATNFMEEKILSGFKEMYLQNTFPEISEQTLAKLAIKRAIKDGIEEDIAVEKVRADFNRAGELLFSFDSGTTAAVKQMRTKLLMAGAGSMNLEIDEIGNNLLGNVDVLATCLELYDIGTVKQKLTKNTNENVRIADIEGRTPTNLLLFGTPSKLLNGGKVEEEFYSFLDTGYARRCIFAYSTDVNKNTELTPEEIYEIMTDTSSADFIEEIIEQFGSLAENLMFNRNLAMSKEVNILLIEYKLWCEKRANELPEHEHIRKAEMSHRYFKALKLAGAYAFVDQDAEISEDTLYSAIKFVEEAGEAFSALLTRERNYVKLAKYIANVGKEITHVDLVEDLPFYKGSSQQKSELMSLAIAYGYKNSIVIQRNINDGIEFIKGESLKPTNLDKLIVSYSQDMASGYEYAEAPFDKFHNLTQLDDFHWCNHAFISNHRSEENASMKHGFNVIVLDVENSVSLEAAQSLLSEYTYHIYTTKQHTDKANRYRIVLPLNYVLHMEAHEFKQFMDNIYEWLPFDVDTSTNQRSRKWRTCKNQYFYNQGELLDALLFIPKTSKNDDCKKVIADLHNLTNLERWFVANTSLGGRNNQLLKYALMLVDSGMDIANTQTNVLRLNSKLQEPLPEAEILSTIMITASKHFYKN